MSHTRAYTVKVPPILAGINSAKMQAYLREYFTHPQSLPANYGPGDLAVCVSVDERLVSKLAEGLAEKPAVALRRLAAAHIRELPATSSAVRESERKRLPEGVAVEPARTDGPEWYPNRFPQDAARTPWRNLAESQREYFERAYAALQKLEPLPEKKVAARVSQPRPLLARLLKYRPLQIMLLAVGALIFFAMWFARHSGRPDSTQAAAKPQYPQWRPE